MLDNAGREISIGDFIRHAPPGEESYRVSGFEGIAKAVAFTDEDEVELETISSPELGIYPSSCLISYATVAEAADAEKEANAAELLEALKRQDAIHSPMTTGERSALLAGGVVGFVLGIIAPAVWQAVIVPIGGYVLWALSLPYPWIKWPFAYVLPPNWATTVAAMIELFLLMGAILCGALVFNRARRSEALSRASEWVVLRGFLVLMLGAIVVVLFSFGFLLYTWAVDLWNAV